MTIKVKKISKSQSRNGEKKLLLLEKMARKRLSTGHYERLRERREQKLRK